MQSMAEVKWGDAPLMLPAVAKVALLSGNPDGEGLYTVRLLFPANYLIPAHAHPKDKHVTVLKGTMYMGMGDKLDTRAGKALPVGSFALTRAGVNHYAYTLEDTTILLHGVGPVDFKYVNPSDDPRDVRVNTLVPRCGTRRRLGQLDAMGALSVGTISPR